MIRRLLLPALAAATALAATTARAGEATAAVSKNVTRSLGTEEPVPLNLFQVDSSYVFSSRFDTTQFGGSSGRPPRSYGRQDEYHFDVEYARRIPLGLFDNRLYLKLGANYERFDFGKTFAPLPTSLQSATGTIALEYVVQGRPAVYLETKPGVFYSDAHDITLGSVDAPTVLAVTFPITKNVFGIAGVRGSVLARYPVLPIGGFVWVITKKARLEAIPPEPRLIYSFSEKLDVFLGGELLGDAYRRDRNNNARPQERRYNNGVIDYSEERVGAGLTYSPTKQIDIDLTGGYSINRDFNYYRGPGKNFRTDSGAPYAKISVKAEF